MRKILAFDFETGGIDKKTDGVLQLAAHMIIDNEIVGSFESKINPVAGKVIHAEALAVNGFTMNQIAQFPDQLLVHNEFTCFLARYIDKFDKTDKCFPLAYNGNFDVDFMVQFFKDCQDDYLGSWWNWRLLDPRLMLNYILYSEPLVKLPDLKLSTVCTFFNIPIKAHDALSDITATWELFKRLDGYLSQHDPLI